MRTMVLVYLPTKLGHEHGANVGIHIPAAWFAYGIYLRNNHRNLIIGMGQKAYDSLNIFIWDQHPQQLNVDVRGELSIQRRSLAECKMGGFTPGRPFIGAAFQMCSRPGLTSCFRKYSSCWTRKKWNCPRSDKLRTLPVPISMMSTTPVHLPWEQLCWHWCERHNCPVSSKSLIPIFLFWPWMPWKPGTRWMASALDLRDTSSMIF